LSLLSLTHLHDTIDSSTKNYKEQDNEDPQEDDKSVVEALKVDVFLIFGKNLGPTFIFNTLLVVHVDEMFSVFIETFTRITSRPEKDGDNQESEDAESHETEIGRLLGLGWFGLEDNSNNNNSDDGNDSADSRNPDNPGKLVPHLVIFTSKFGGLMGESELLAVFSCLSFDLVSSLEDGFTVSFLDDVLVFSKVESGVSHGGYVVFVIIPFVLFISSGGVLGVFTEGSATGTNDLHESVMSTRWFGMFGWVLAEVIIKFDLWGNKPGLVSFETVSTGPFNWGSLLVCDLLLSIEDHWGDISFIFGFKDLETSDWAGILVFGAGFFIGALHALEVGTGLETSWAFIFSGLGFIIGLVGSVGNTEFTSLPGLKTNMIFLINSGTIAGFALAFVDLGSRFASMYSSWPFVKTLKFDFFVSSVTCTVVSRINERHLEDRFLVDIPVIVLECRHKFFVVVTPCFLVMFGGTPN